MEPFATSATAELIKMGLPGIVIVALAWAYYRKDALVNTLQDRRVQDAKDITMAMQANTAATQAQTESLNNLRLLVQGALK